MRNFTSLQNQPAQKANSTKVVSNSVDARQLKDKNIVDEIIETPGLKYSLNNLHIHAPVIRPKLIINQPNDIFEQEADAVAEKITRTSPAKASQPRITAAYNGHPHVQGGEKDVNDKGENGNKYLQEKSIGGEYDQNKHGEKQDLQSGRPGNTNPAIPAVNQILQSPGQPMDIATRSFMERGFGYSFSKVKIYDNPAAHQSAKDINALAYTQGNNIVFGAGQYQPEGVTGKYLLAHELTHVVQQSGNMPDSAQGGGIVQRFASEEHQLLGDVATTNAKYNLGTATDKLELTHGDIVALSGDVFLPDELFRLAAIPGNLGQSVGTRDEVIWALQDPRIWEMKAEPAGSNRFAQKKDPRFQKGGVFGGFIFSDAVKDTVFEKYQKLGAANASHFVKPSAASTKAKPGSPVNSSVSNYVAHHETAISMADKEGRSATNIDMAMAQEAAAQHYLTDSFSAGHLRTPIKDIRDYWGSKYPLFWFNLRHKIALDTAIEMTKGTIITNHFAYGQLLARVEAMAPTLPAVTLGDLVASVFHDVDNETGLNIKGGGKVFGDRHLDAGTEKLAVDAIKAGNNDITKAYDHGVKTPTPIPDADLFAKISVAGGGKGGKYAPQLLIPEVDKKEPAQNWKASDINTLWDQKFLGTKGDTVGQVISKRVQGGAIAIQLIALGDKFPVSQNAVVATLQPRNAYLVGFVKKLQNDPKAGVLDIVHWAPHGMWTGGEAPRNVAADLQSKGAAGNTVENLANMTFEQRVKFVKGLKKGGEPADIDMIITIFESISVKERKKLYEAVEGRPWNGTIKTGDKFAFEILVKDKWVDDKVKIDKLKKVIKGP